MNYIDSLCHDLIDAAIHRWIDEHIDYVGEPWWEWGAPGYIDIYYHWMGQSECIHVSVDAIKEATC